jgi:NADPH-dependent glutamate synthase beta subunit-like oxidoreductase
MPASGWRAEGASVPGEDLAGAEDAIAISSICVKSDAVKPIRRRVVAIGGGNTAIDIAVQANASARG